MEGQGLNLRLFSLSGAVLAPLLFFLLTACAGQPQAAGAAGKGPDDGGMASTTLIEDKLQRVSQAAKTDASGTTVDAVLPKDVLSKKDLKKDPPKYEDWHKEGSDDYGSAASGSSAGAIPAVRPFNFGRDPGGPDDKTLYLTVPKLGLKDVTAYNSVKDEKLKKSTVHIPATGFPWQKGANTYIAGHRVGYEGTNSYLVFYYLEQLVEDDEILLEDTAGTTYTYRVTDQLIVDPDNVEVMEPEEGKSLVSLQTCTLPDYKQRLIVQGELVDKSG
jgi:sortase A